MTPADAAEAQRAFDASALAAGLGLRCLLVTDRRARVEMRVDPALRHPNGAVPGVLLGALCERAAALARTAAGGSGVPSAMSMRFVRGAFGDVVDAHAHVVDGTLVTVRLRDAADRVCATGTVTWAASGDAA